MNWLRNVENWGKDAWSAIWGGISDIPQVLAKLWHLAASLGALINWVIDTPVKQAFLAIWDFQQNVRTDLHKLADALERVRDWIYTRLIAPFRQQVITWINQTRAIERRDVHWLYKYTTRMFRYAIHYTQLLVGTERRQRAAADLAVRHYAQFLVTAALALVQREASGAYNSQLRDRLPVLERLAADLADRDPLLRDLAGKAITAIIDLAGVEDPALRLLLAYLCRQLAARAGVDQPAAALLQLLTGQLAGEDKPRDLSGVIRDLAARTGALEAQWAQFLAEGGVEVEQAGREWRDLTTLVTDAGLLAFFGTAAANPSAWAADISATAGQIVASVSTGIESLIRKV